MCVTDQWSRDWEGGRRKKLIKQRCFFHRVQSKYSSKGFFSKNRVNSIAKLPGPGFWRIKVTDGKKMADLQK